jgi:oligogalacturonide transport system permease protein
MKIKQSVGHYVAYLFLLILLIVMIYPLIWMVMASFKSNDEIFNSLSILPREWITSSFASGWKGNGQVTYTTFFLNTFALVIPTVLATVASSSLVAYGFSRFDFRLRKPLFALVIGSLLLPQEVLIVPQYLIFHRFGWTDSYLPFIVPAAFACYPFFIFMLVQFFRGFPAELEEAARIDGCNSFVIFWRIILPLSKPALFSVAIFQFMWRWNDFFNSLIYINSTRKFTVPLALRMSLDLTGTVNWNEIMAMSVLSMIPLILLFIFAQRYFIEGIATTGIKG